jgi:hypothetical protein
MTYITHNCENNGSNIAYGKRRSADMTSEDGKLRRHAGWQRKNEPLGNKQRRRQKQRRKGRHAGELKKSDLLEKGN